MSVLRLGCSFAGLCLAVLHCSGVETIALDDCREHIFDFAITNSTRETQTIKDVRLSCACLKIASDVSSKILPGEVFPLKVAFNPNGMEGKVSKTVEVVLSPSEESVTFEMSVLVKVRCGLYPRRVALGAVNQHQVSFISRHFELAGYSVGENSVRLVSAEGPSNSVFSVRLDDAGMGLNVGVAREFVPRVGRYAEIWKIVTSDSEVKTIMLPVSMDIVGEFEIIPSELKVRNRAGIQRLSVLLRPLDGSRTVVLEAKTIPRKWGEVKVFPRVKGGWKIEIEEVDSDKVRQFSKQAYLEIKTDSRQMPVVKLPLEVF